MAHSIRPPFVLKTFVLICVFASDHCSFKVILFFPGEFELTLKAEVGPADELNTSLTEGFWACTCTAKIGGEIQSL